MALPVSALSTMACVLSAHFMPVPQHSKMPSEFWCIVCELPDWYQFFPFYCQLLCEKMRNDTC